MLIAVLIAVVGSPAAGIAAEPGASGAAPAVNAPAENAPPVEEWLNQSVWLRDTAQAMDRPAADGKSMGEIRKGAEVKAIAILAGKLWVQIELPNHAIAYIPKSAVDYANGAPPPPAPPERQNAGPPSTKPDTAAAPEAVRGPVGSVPNAATLVVADRRIRLSGIDPGPQSALASFETWVKAQGALLCEPDAQTGRYRCFTGGGVDVAEAAILNGAGRVGDGAMPAYRSSENAARQGMRGLWAQQP